MKTILALFFMLILIGGSYAQKKKLDSTTVNITYHHLVFKYNENEMKFTNTMSRFEYENEFYYGFRDFNDERLQFIDEKLHKEIYIVKYTKDPKVDTINTVLWYDSKLPENESDSILVCKKFEYAFALYKNNEKRLNIDSTPKLRITSPCYLFSGRGPWLTRKLCIYPDSAIYTEKYSNLKDYNGLRINSESRKKLKKKKQAKLLIELNKLRQYKGYEYQYKDSSEKSWDKNHFSKKRYSKNDYLYMDHREMVEYFDGKTEYTFIMPPKNSSNDKELYQIFINIVDCLITYY